MTSTLMAPQGKPQMLSDHDLQQLHAWWRAANYLAVGMIYLQDNPLLKEPLRP
jgi:xylulose-5-phosphate/fructose-6-phosphate phosphoketolase